MRLSIQALRSRWDFLLLAALVGGFVFVAAQRLGAVPVPEGDEAFTLQVPYEMLNHGKLALPMLRYLGGNIENVWHSFTPVCFVLMTGFLKLFGFGLEQGRAFNLLTAATTLLMIYVIGRRLFDWRAGLFAVLMMLGDQTFIERSRLLRNDYAAATFALLAFYLFEVARARRGKGFTVASGLAAGAGVMCHTNILYIIIAIGLLILIDDGWRALKQSRLYLFGLSAFAVMAYEVVYDLIDYRNFTLQNRGDDRAVDGGLLAERARRAAALRALVGRQRDVRRLPCGGAARLSTADGLRGGLPRVRLRASVAARAACGRAARPRLRRAARGRALSRHHRQPQTHLLPRAPRAVVRHRRRHSLARRGGARRGVAYK